MDKIKQMKKRHKVTKQHAVDPQENCSTNTEEESGCNGSHFIWLLIKWSENELQQHPAASLAQKLAA